MHTELNQAEDTTNPNITIPDYINPSNNIEVFGYFIKEYIKKHKSIFSSYFHGLNHLISTCNRCQTQTHSYNLFSFIIFPLLEVRKMVTSEGNYPKNFRNYFDLSIEDCFLYAQKKGFYKGDKKCNKCQFESDYWLEKKIIKLPNILILIFDRGNLENYERFTFNEIIDLKNYVEFPQGDNKYFLSGVIHFLGEHLIAYCRMSSTLKWYCYNDSLVRESNFEEIKLGSPIILFYQKCVINSKEIFI